MKNMCRECGVLSASPPSPRSKIRSSCSRSRPRRGHAALSGSFIIWEVAWGAASITASPYSTRAMGLLERSLCCSCRVRPTAVPTWGRKANPHRFGGERRDRIAACTPAARATSRRLYIYIYIYIYKGVPFSSLQPRPKPVSVATPS